MISRDFVVQNKVGLHARPASLLVKKASDYKSTIELQNGGRTANAKSILSLLSLGAGKGSKLVVTADGEDENEAMEAILKMMAEFKD